MNNLKLPILIVAAILIVGGIYFFVIQPQQGQQTATSQQTETSLKQEPRGEDIIRPEGSSRSKAPQSREDHSDASSNNVPDLSRTASASDNATTETDSGETDETLTGINLDNALSPRILGNPDAPIRVSEHSSLTCSHCGNFHKTTFSQFKIDYLDTGKAYLVFSDFPLNGPALHASMTARCLPKERFFDFVQMLFEKQNEWAYDKNYRDYLKKVAASYGLNSASFEACLSSAALQEGILNLRQSAQAKWDISSTPSFVVNNETVVSGALPYEDFTKEIEGAVSGPADE